jgi:hypothetical protein
MKTPSNCTVSVMGSSVQGPAEQITRFKRMEFWRMTPASVAKPWRVGQRELGWNWPISLDSRVRKSYK